MSHALYNNMWQQAMEELAEQIEMENPPVELNEQGKPLPDRPISWSDAYQHYAVLYLRYLQILQKLEDCYDQCIHPQKRRDMKLVLECVMARIAQIKPQLVKFGPDGRQSDYLNLEDLALDLKLTPNQLEVPIPRMFREKSDSDDTVRKRDLLEKCLEEHGLQHTTTTDEGHGLIAGLITKMTKEQAIRIIQKNERGRQGAVRAKLMKELREEDVARRRLSATGQHERDPTAAATLIQKTFRGHLARMRISKLASDELVFIGMRHASRKDVNGKMKYDPVVKEQQIRRQRKTRQADNELKYVEALVDLRRQVHDSEGPEMKDQMWEARYQWWIQQKQQTGKYPTDFTQFYRDCEPQSLDEKDAEALRLAAEKAKKPKKSKEEREREAKEKKKQEERDLAKAATKRGQQQLAAQEAAKMALTLRTLVGPTNILHHMLECLTKYQTVWSTIDESENYAQGHDETLAKEKLRPMVRDQIRREVDVRLLAYLDNIKLKVQQRAALAKQRKEARKRARKAKKEAEKNKIFGVPPASPSKKKSSTKKKSTQKKKVRKCCDGEKACIHMSLQDMITLLVKMGILQEVKKPHKGVAEFQGGINYLGTQYVQAGMTMDPSMAQIRACLTEYAILPLGSSYVKEQTPLINSILLYGAQGTGKTMLAKAVALETNACWFDLSPRTIERKLGSRAEIAKLVHMIFKVAQELAPSVIYIDEIEKMLMNGKSKKNTSELAKLKHQILAHKHMLTRQNRTLIIANSRQPYLDRVDRTDMMNWFGPRHHGKMLFLPAPNYPTRLKLWKHFLSEAGMNLIQLEKNPKFDLITLAYISEGYSAGSIAAAVQATLPPRRVQKLLESGRAFDSSELIAALAKTGYTYRHDYAAYQKFTDEVSGEKERRALKEAAEAKEEEAKQEEEKKNRRRYSARVTKSAGSGQATGSIVSQPLTATSIPSGIISPTSYATTLGSTTLPRIRTAGAR